MAADIAALAEAGRCPGRRRTRVDQRRTRLTGDTATPSSFELEPGSFRDPDARVIYSGDDRVLRGLSEQGAEAWRQLSHAPFFHRLTDHGRVIGTRVAADITPATLGWAAVLEHERVPFVSYPFEWSFGMLRDAALLHLEVLLDALTGGMTTKDGSAYNVQWRGTSPVFIDVSSISPSSGGPWEGYRQFCETFLNPLLVQACRGVDFQPWLRGRLEGMPTSHTRRLLSGRDMARKGVLKHVVLHDVLQRRSTSGAQAAKHSLSAAGFGVGLTRAVVSDLIRVVRALDWRPGPSSWSRYADQRPYNQNDLDEKKKFVQKAMGDAAPRLVWDLGCNDGTFSRAAAPYADYVVAMDADHPTVQQLYRSLRKTRERKILPLVVDVADPSPPLGWRGQERRTLTDRGRPDVVLCLALVHHLSITANIPLDEIVSWLHSLQARVVVEFVDRTDPMVQRLLADKAIRHDDYTAAGFEDLLARRFAFRQRVELSTGNRRLYDALPK
jgi:hypothetical protein